MVQLDILVSFAVLAVGWCANTALVAPQTQANHEPSGNYVLALVANWLGRP